MEKDELERQIMRKFSVQHYLNTTVYRNGTTFILSPFIGKNNSRHWFDIRDVNLQRQANETNKYLVLRDEQYGIIICKLLPFSKQMTQDDASIVTKHSGKHWKFFLQKNDDGKYFIKGQHRGRIYYADHISLKDIKNV
jgi:hypothetical protein